MEGERDRVYAYRCIYHDDVMILVVHNITEREREKERDKEREREIKRERVILKAQVPGVSMHPPLCTDADDLLHCSATVGNLGERGEPDIIT